MPAALRYKNVRYLLLKAKRMALTNAEFVELQQLRKAALSGRSVEFLLRVQKGLIRHIGLSNVTTAQIAEAQPEHPLSIIFTRI